MNRSSITVVIPVWDDYVRYLAGAVESVRADSPECSIVVVDNASATLLPPLAGIEVVRSAERLSVGGARNLALASLDCDYVTVLDADDEILPGTLRLLRERLDADLSLAACVTSILDGETEQRHRNPRRFTFALARWPRLFALVECVWSLYPTQGCTMFRLTHARAAGGYGDASFGEDWVLAVSLAFRGRVELDDHLGLYYRHTDDSLERRPRSTKEVLGSARLVRTRLRSDPAVPRWARAMLPLIASLQMLVVCAMRPLYLAARRIKNRGEGEPAALSGADSAR